MTENEQRIRGMAMVDVLGLRMIRDGSANNGRYRTAWGCYTALGLYRMMELFTQEKLDGTAKELVTFIKENDDHA